MSTLSSNFATLVCGNSLQASSSEYFFVRSPFAAAFRYFFPSAIFRSFAARSGPPTVAQVSPKDRFRVLLNDWGEPEAPQSTTSMPSDFAVPATVRIAASRSVVLRSGSLIVAISFNCFLVIFPTLVLFGSFEPLPGFLAVGRPSAFLIRMAAGGVLVMKVNDRSEITVFSTGMIRSSFVWACVRALNCLQNSMMLTPCWPSAGPIGGDGLALPAGTCSLMYPVTFFIFFPDPYERTRTLGLRLLDLREVELDRGGPAEDGDVDPHLLLLGLDLDDGAGEVRERTVDHPHGLGLLERDAGLGARGALGHRDVEVLDLGLLHGLRIGAAQEAGDLGCVLDQVE